MIPSMTSSTAWTSPSETAAPGNRLLEHSTVNTAVVSGPYPLKTQKLIDCWLFADICDECVQRQLCARIAAIV